MDQNEYTDEWTDGPKMGRDPRRRARDGSRGRRPLQARVKRRPADRGPSIRPEAVIIISEINRL